MLIPSIDLMGGKIVQLVQGKKKALEFDDFDAWIERFSSYPLVQLIDLDAAMGNGSNRNLIADICRKLPCQVGGGIRSTEEARAMLDCGAKTVIIGSSLIKEGTIDEAFAKGLSDRFGSERLIFAVDSRGGRVAIHGWKTITEIRPDEMMRRLAPSCSAFLYTHIDTEGLMQGIPLETVRQLRQITTCRLIAAGGIRSAAEIEQLDQMGVDAVVGMAIYSGLLKA
ncbi:MAG TPA: 1-(5-phosphoribosyl)-5-[(5-phosphoribosylamino)methylideneamino] imidazole-4-carboxamide isomerase [Bryocella sp.]|nr:1-(5-phosphoribosyl)-5-[(5-phosphoribosylamino)methylideneamino] imidazole-4-carboxamide isomerase [Bryocella sp.]